MTAYRVHSLAAAKESTGNNVGGGGISKVLLALILLLASPAFAGEPGVIPIIPLERTEKHIIRNMIHIPAGEFVFAEGKHTLDLPGYFIDKNEVTNGEFVKFINRFGSGRVGQGAVSWLDVDSPYCLIERDGFRYRVKPGCENLPVVEVSWFGAKAYAAWQNKRLPTEAEWEKAAGGAEGYTYPWGEELPEKYSSLSGEPILFSFFKNDRSVFGVLNMAGGVWEWCKDPYYPEPLLTQSPAKGKKGFADYRVVKGGTWRNISDVRLAVRSFSAPFDRAPRIGFRCAYTSKGHK